MELNAVTRSVNDLFSVNKKYIVPRFQREYSWKTEHINEFWDDIMQQISIDGTDVRYSEYFVGCIVLVGEDAKSEYLIVDGQQRLTTITILLRSIVDRLISLGDEASGNAVYRNVIEGIDDDGNQYFKLVNETPKPYFQEEIQVLKRRNQARPESDEEKRLANASLIFDKKLSSATIGELDKRETIKAIRDQVLKYLKFILVTAKDEDDAYTIFETLNARGMGLSSVDLIKNWIFKNCKDSHPSDYAKNKWNKIKKTITGFSDLETFFRHYWNSKYAFVSNDRLYKSFNENRKRDNSFSAIDFLKELESASVRYRKICDPSAKDWTILNEKPIQRHFDLLNQYKVTQVRPFLLALLECRAEKYIGETEFVRTVRNLENFHFVFSNICQSRASGIEGTYTRSAKDLYDAGDDRGRIKKVLLDLNDYLVRKRPKDHIIQNTVKELMYYNGYDANKRTIQTIFTKIENYLQETDELSVFKFSLEHIRDQSSEDDWIGMIGNLLPLDVNLNNRIPEGSTFSQKKEIYQKSSFRIVRNFLCDFPDDIWEKTDAEGWQSTIATWAEMATRIQPL